MSAPTESATHSAYIARLRLPARVGPYEAHRRVYALSKHRPIFRRMGDVALAVYREPLDTTEIKPYSPQIVAGDRFHFVLYADVSKTRFQEGGRGQRYDPILEARNADPARPYAEIARQVGGAWLEQKGLKHGFDVEQLDLADYQPLQFVRPKTRNTIRLPAVDFQGYLRATDPNAFTSMLISGLGRGKAFGLGLMLLRRA